MIVETVDIIRDLVASLQLKVVVDSVADNMDGTYTVTTKCTRHIQSGMSFSVSGVDYVVISFERDVSFTVLGASTISVSSFLLPAPKFWHGSILETNKTLTGIADMSEKVPMVYLRRPYKDNFNRDDSAIERDSDVTLYFLCEDNFQQYDIDDRDKECIYPMRSLLYSFVEMLKNNSQIGIIDSFDVENKERFGVVNSKGVEKALFDTPLSGCELNIIIPIKKNYQCKC
ncbi:MAG: hypothetical protein VKL60_20890 [Sphaerospermopsis sp.]|nr:hypothetical protein [Sphaerospermopsis sp.]